MKAKGDGNEHGYKALHKKFRTDTPTAKEGRLTGTRPGSTAPTHQPHALVFQSGEKRKAEFEHEPAMNMATKHFADMMMLFCGGKM